MQKCEDCNIILDKAVRFCPKCGKEVSCGEGANQMPKLEVGAYLTSANLHRIRKEWDEAVADATEALRLDPKNADIASLLGAIYQERGMLEDAMIWFQMALEMNPNSTSDRARLKDVKAQMALSARGQSPNQFNLLDRRTRVWAIAIGAIFIVVVILALVLALGRHNQQDVAGSVNYGRQAEPSDRVSEHNSDAPPIIPPSGTTAPVRQPAHSETASRPSSTADSSLRTPAELKISQDVSQAQDIGSAKVDDVIADPRQSIVIVTFSIPASALNKSAVLTAAGAVARAAFAANSEVKSVTARCLVSPSGQSTTQIAFVGDISRQSIEALETSATADQVQASFTNQWWNPQIK